MKRVLLTGSVVLALAGCGVDSGGLGSIPDGGCTDTWAGYGETFFTSTCGASCHGGNYTSQANVKASASHISSVISSGEMPRGSSLSAATKERILGYLACGAP